MSDEAELMTAEEVALLYRVKPPTVYRWATADPPVIPSVTIGGARRFRRSEIEALIAPKRGAA